MKKTALLLLIGILLLPFHVFAYAQDTTKKVFHTDITAYINEYPIKSYNIDGQIGVCIDDLVKYGFRLEILLNYPNLYRIEYEGYFKNTPEYTTQTEVQNLTNMIGYAHKSDKIIQINGNEVECYDINGKQVILMDALKYCGNVTWYANERKTCFEYIPSINDIYHNDNDEFIYRFSIALIKNAMGKFEVSENNNCYLKGLSLGYEQENGLYIKFSVSSNASDVITKSFRDMLYDIISTDVKDNVVEKNIAFANEHIKTTVNGKPCNITTVYREYRENYFDYYFYLDADVINKEEIQSFEITYK